MKGVYITFFCALALNLTLVKFNTGISAEGILKQTFEQELWMPDLLNVSEFLDTDEDERELQTLCNFNLAPEDLSKLALIKKLQPKPLGGLKKSQLLTQLTNLPPPAL